MKAIIKILISGVFLFTFLSCSKSNENDNGEPKFEKGYTTGKVIKTITRSIMQKLSSVIKR